MKTNQTPKKLSKFNFFLAVLRTVTVTLGGGYAICPALGNIFIANDWIQEETFYCIVARAQSIPGPIAFNTALLSGIHFFGLPGIIPAFFGVILTPFIIILILGSFLLTTRIIFINRFLEGARFVIPGIVLSFALKNAKSRSWNFGRFFSVFILAVLFVVFPQWAIPILFGGIIVCYLLEIRE